jgi:hypothetical protein
MINSTTLNFGYGIVIGLFIAVTFKPNPVLIFSFYIFLLLCHGYLYLKRTQSKSFRHQVKKIDIALPKGFHYTKTKADRNHYFSSVTTVKIFLNKEEESYIFLEKIELDFCVADPTAILYSSMKIVKKEEPVMEETSLKISKNKKLMSRKYPALIASVEGILCCDQDEEYYGIENVGEYIKLRKVMVTDANVLWIVWELRKKDNFALTYNNLVVVQ